MEIFGRKVDPEQTIVGSVGNDFLLTGKDKILRKYKIPEDNITKLNLAQKVATNPPSEELDGH